MDKLHQVHSDLLKRLDDNSDEVRMAVTRTLAAYARSELTEIIPTIATAENGSSLFPLCVHTYIHQLMI